ncbi:hypothetical protein RRG08_003175 [Elysia crispata]|uniref:Secreted protein n=1 Tax=Elysia crispata TaxID=231223 RepID=A0AAE1B8C7_9GAST|nr:hypothetical protein RRG08_003175 [Elysia crispata]
MLSCTRDLWSGWVWCLISSVSVPVLLALHPLTGPTSASQVLSRSLFLAYISVTEQEDFIRGSRSKDSSTTKIFFLFHAELGRSFSFTSFKRLESGKRSENIGYRSPLIWSKRIIVRES